MKKILALFCGVLIFVGCGSELETTSKLTYEPNQSGLATELPDAPQSESPGESPGLGYAACSEGIVPQAIVSLSPTATEMLFEIGAGGQVIAVDNYSYWPSEAPVVDDLSGWNPNVEAIADFQPDLVILSDSGVQEELELLGIPVYVATAAVVLEDVYDQMVVLGEITCNRLGALEAVTVMERYVDALLEIVDGAGEGLTYYHELDDTLYSVTSATFIGQIYAMTGLQNIADPADEGGASFGYPQLSEEFVLSSDPDIIFYADAQCCGQSAETISARPGWSDLKAVQNGHVFEMDPDISSRWGPRLVRFLEVVIMAIQNVNGN